MFIEQSLKSSFARVLYRAVLPALAIVLLFVINTEAVQAQSYQKRPQASYGQYPSQAGGRPYQGRRQYRPQKQKGLIDTLFGGAGSTPPKRRVRQRRVRRKAVRQTPVVRHRPARPPRTRPKTIRYKPRKSALKKASVQKKKEVALKGYRHGLQKGPGKLPASFSRPSPKKGGGRAMCVRLCDGFYWPVSRVESGYKKKKAAMLCKNSCAVTTRVYYASYYGDTAMSMQDRRGNRYRDLKNAFKYRKKYSRSCRCRPEPWSKAAQRVYDRREKVSGKDTGKTRQAGTKQAGKPDKKAAKKKRVARLKKSR